MYAMLPIDVAVTVTSMILVVVALLTISATHRSIRPTPLLTIEPRIYL